MAKPFYITTTLPYVNAKPHVGFALELIQTDVIARYHRMIGDEVVFNTGTDEHGLKIFQKAAEEGMEPQEYVDVYASSFNTLKSALNVSWTKFIRTTDPNHKQAAQEFWKRCATNGDIYKATYKVKYCVGCELEKTDSELVRGKCPDHPKMKIEKREEENYFFKFSNYEKPLLKLYKDHPDFVVPDYRLKEIQQFVKGGLQDFSVSRLKSKMPWGVAVPGDEEHVMYVWFDALVNYISTLGWPQDDLNFEKYWPGVQTAGKDNLRQQSAMWQEMLMSAGLKPSKQILIHGHLTADGKKMSKSLGNVIDPIAVVEKYNTDALRYYLLAEFNPWADGDFSWKKFEDRYTADLANGIGNLAARVTTLASRLELKVDQNTSMKREYKQMLSEYRFNEAMEYIWQKMIRSLDKYINDKEPWTLQGDEFEKVMQKAVDELYRIGFHLQPLLPETAATIMTTLANDKIRKIEVLFPKV